MFALQVTALFLLAFSAFCFFVPPLVAYGPRAWPVLLKQPQVRFVGGFISTAIAFVLAAPYLSAAMVTGGELIADTTMDIFTMSFGIV